MSFEQAGKAKSQLKLAGVESEFIIMNSNNEGSY